MKSLHRWSAVAVLLGGFFIVCAPALAQWQVPNNEIPVGRGAGTGFASVYTPPGSGAVARTVTSKLAEVVSVKDFGSSSIGDCSTDASPAIQAAINYASLSGGGTVYLPQPASCYGISSTLTIPSTVTILGTGIGNCIRPLASMTDLVRITGNQGASIRNICLANQSSRATNGVNFYPTSYGNNLLVAENVWAYSFVNNFYNSNAEGFRIINSWSQNATGYSVRSVFGGTESVIDKLSVLGDNGGIYYSPGIVSTSVTSNTIGTGSKTFTVGSGFNTLPNQPVTVTSGANSMTGTVTSYSGTTLVINVTSVSGGGTYSSWDIASTTTEGAKILDSNILVTGTGKSIQFDQGLFIQIANTNVTGKILFDASTYAIANVNIDSVYITPSSGASDTVGFEASGNVADLNINALNSGGFSACGLKLVSTASYSVQRVNLTGSRFLQNGTGVGSADLCVDSTLNGVGKLSVSNSWFESTGGSVSSVLETGGNAITSTYSPTNTYAAATTSIRSNAFPVSGGIPFIDSSLLQSYSAALTQYAVTLGGGAGGTPVSLGSLGTTTTVLHGNAAGAPTFGAVSLTADVSGTLPVANGGTNCSVASGTCLDNITAFSTTGMMARTGVGTYAFRTMLGTANEITITGADGSSAPTFSLPSALTFTGKTITGGTFSGPTLSGTVAGAPTWGSNQAITLSTASQPNITGVGTLTSGGTGVGFTVALGTSTVTGTIPNANLPGAWTSWTPAATCNGTNVDGTNGSIVTYAKYQQFGKTVNFAIDFTCRNNAGTGAVAFNAPFNAAGSMSAIGRETATTGSMAGFVLSSGFAAAAVVSYNNGTTWEQGSRFLISGTYEVP